MSAEDLMLTALALTLGYPVAGALITWGVMALLDWVDGRSS